MGTGEHLLPGHVLLTPFQKYITDSVYSLANNADSLRHPCVTYSTGLPLCFATQTKSPGQIYDISA